MRNRAFTLVEMLTVLVIITSLMALLLPSLISARLYSREVVWAQQQHQMTLALFNYAGAFEERLPPLEKIGGLATPSIFNSDRGRNWGDVLVEQELVDGADVFHCPTLTPDPDEDRYDISVGLNRHFAQAEGTYDQISGNDLTPQDWRNRGVIEQNMGPRISSIPKPSQKLLLTDSISGSPHASLTAVRGAALVRHTGFAGVYSFFDGHTAKISFRNFYGKEYDPNLPPTELASSTFLENLRRAGMSTNVTRYGNHYKSAEVFAPWAPWDGQGIWVLGMGTLHAGRPNHGHGNNADGADASNPSNGHGGPNADGADTDTTVDDESNGNRGKR